MNEETLLEVIQCQTKSIEGLMENQTIMVAGMQLMTERINYLEKRVTELEKAEAPPDG